MNENEEIMADDHIMQKNFKFFGLVSGVYACFFTICLYQNASGLTMLPFVAGTLYYFYLCMKKLGISIKKDSYFYEAAILLLGCATWITDDERIILMNYLGIFILLVSFMLHQFFQDKEWDIPQYIDSFLRSLFGTIGCIPQPFFHFNHMIKSKEKEKNQSIQYVFMGLIISIPIIIIILMLLSSADFVFANALEFMWKGVVIPENIIGMTLMTIFAFFAAYCFLAFLTKDRTEGKKGRRREGEPIIAITFTSLIALIYLIFSGIQVIYLFMGKMQLQNNYTYAQYAREGFFQLVAVCLLNLALVIFCIYYYKNHKVLKAILTIISLCTYIMIASSAFRMSLYISQYELTFLRLFVLWALVVIFAMITGTIIFIIKPEFRFLKYTIVTVTALYIVFSFSHPDYFIAKYNYSDLGFIEVDRIDSDYLSELCGDAAPAILDYTEQLKKETGLSLANSSIMNFESYFSRIFNNGKDMNIRTFNLSRYAGKNAAEEFMLKNK